MQTPHIYQNATLCLSSKKLKLKFIFFLMISLAFSFQSMATPQIGFGWTNSYIKIGDTVHFQNTSIGGRKILFQKINGGDYPIRIDLSKVSNGIYAYKLSINGNKLNNGIITVNKK